MDGWTAENLTTETCTTGRLKLSAGGVSRSIDNCTFDNCDLTV